MSIEKFYLTSDSLLKFLLSIKKGRDKVETSPDLNYSKCEIPLGEGSVSLCGRSFTSEELKTLVKKIRGKVMLLENGEMRELAFFAGKYYKLYPTVRAPTIEIDGIRMHRTQNIDPWEDSRRKVNYALEAGDAALDTCGGLGYTAIWALKLGAERVVSVEKDTNVIEMRRLNPHSEAFFDERIQAVEGDVFELMGNFKEDKFDCIIHDPPRFSLAGNLYGFDFYCGLHRVLKPRGRMVHYVGDPYSKGRGRRFAEGVMKRLREAGFQAEHFPRDSVVKCISLNNL